MQSSCSLANNNSQADVMADAVDQSPSHDADDLLLLMMSGGQVIFELISIHSSASMRVTRMMRSGSFALVIELRKSEQLA